jgi:acyl-coenzyme A synthetase/AMP-(fatty) acid ligase
MNHMLLTPLSTMQSIFATNVFGTFLFCREAARLMSSAKVKGRIVNFATVATPLKLEGEAAYAASKAAVVSLTEVLARELAPLSITVNAVGPTPIETDLIRSVPKAKMDALIARQAVPAHGHDGRRQERHRLLPEGGERLHHRPGRLPGGRVSAIDFLLDTFREHADEEAIVWRDQSSSFSDLRTASWTPAPCCSSSTESVPGSVVALEADFSPQGIAYLLALFHVGAIVVPLAPASAARHEEFRRIAQVTHRVRMDSADRAFVSATGATAAHPLYDALRTKGHPGLILFTSGSSGEPKAALHDGVRLLAKYRTPRHRLRTLLFLLFDHIGGFDTLLQALSNACAVIVPTERTPDGVAQAIARHRVEVLPASPSFLGLLLLSEAHRRHDLSSLRYITYGAEVMRPGTLARLHEAFPGVTLLQKYGLTELGTMRSRSNANDSLWVRIGGEGFQTRVRDGLLEIRAESSMLGYLNAPSPFTDDGWFMTGDAVEQQGESFRILGRASDLINVGGRKVYPAEVEAVIAEVENVQDVVGRGRAAPVHRPGRRRARDARAPRGPRSARAARARALPREAGGLHGAVEGRDRRRRAHDRARQEDPPRMSCEVRPVHPEDFDALLPLLMRFRTRA